MKKKLTLIVIFLVTALPVFSEGTQTLISWPGWTVSSTEDLYLGHKHTSFPLTYLFDGSPVTAWIFSGTGKHLRYQEGGYAISMNRDEDRRPVTFDSIWIMNGYNKSSELFLRNNRIVELKLYLNGKFQKTVALADSTRWHKISLPRQPVREIKLRFTRFAKGRDNDVCVSEIALYDLGRKVDLGMPNAVEFTRGDGDCGDGQSFSIVSRAGKVLARYSSDSQCVWSPSGRRVAGGDTEYWVVDAYAGKVILRQSLISTGAAFVSDISWKDDNRLELDIEKDIPPKNGGDDYRETHYTKTINLGSR